MIIVAETKEGERVYTIPLRDAYQKSMRIRSRYAVDIVRNFLRTHMKSKDVRLGRNLNEAIWERGMKKPPRRVKVSAIKEGDTVKAELFGHKYEEFKALPKKERKGMREKLMERLGPLAAKKQEEEKMAEGKEEKTEVKAEVKEEVKAETKAESGVKTEVPTVEVKEVKPKIAKGRTAKKIE